MTATQTTTSQATTSPHRSRGVRRTRRVAVSVIGTILVLATIVLVSTASRSDSPIDAASYDLVDLNRAGAVSIISRRDPVESYSAVELNRAAVLQSMGAQAMNVTSTDAEGRTNARPDSSSEDAFAIAEQNRMAAAATID